MWMVFHPKQWQEIDTIDGFSWNGIAIDSHSIAEHVLYVVWICISAFHPV